MRNALIVAKRDYFAAVRTRAFLISLLLMPLLSLFAVGVQFIIARGERDTAKTYAIIDRSRSLRASLEEANARRTAVEILDPTTKMRVAPAFTLEFVEPSADDPAAIQDQRYALTQRAQRNEIEGFLDIGPDVLKPTPRTADEPDERTSMRIQSADEIDRVFATWADKAVTNAVQARRLAEHGVAPEVVREVQMPVRQKSWGAMHVDPKTGKVVDATEARRIASFALPALFVALMLLVVILASVPAMQGVVEEKQQRIAEVLLGCLTPFELMLGKLLGVVGISLTISSVYLAGAAMVAATFGLAGLLSIGLLIWFGVFLILATMMYGSLFMAVGAAAGDLKETQSLQMPVTTLIVLPMMMLGSILREPNGKLATIGSFIPFSSPMMMMARLSTSSETPFWQPALAALGVLATALGCVWAAGRIFRVGLLLQGKGVKLADLVKWVVRG